MPGGQAPVSGDRGEYPENRCVNSGQRLNARRNPRRGQLKPQRIGDRPNPNRIVVVEVSPHLRKSSRLRYSADDTERRKQFTGITLAHSLFAKLERSSPSNNERIDVGLKTRLEIVQGRPFSAWLIQERLAQVVQRRCLFEVFSVKSVLETLYRRFHAGLMPRWMRRSAIRRAERLDHADRYA